MSVNLKGAHIVVTRPRHQAENLCRLIEKNGGVAVRFPTLEIVGIDSLHSKPDGHTSLETKQFPTISEFHWLIFISVNAVNFALKAIGGKIDEFKVAKIAAIGQATARELIGIGLPPLIIPDQGFNSEALLALPEMQVVDCQAILIVRGRGGREELANVLKSRGATVHYWDVYRRVIPEIKNYAAIKLLEQGLLDVIIITSGEALLNLLTMFGATYKKKLAAVQLVVISDRISRLAVELGFTQITVAENPSDSAILKTALALINEEYSG